MRERERYLSCHPQEIAEDIAGAVHFSILSTKGRHLHPGVTVFPRNQSEILDHQNTVPHLHHRLDSFQTIHPIALDVLKNNFEKEKKKKSQLREESYRFHDTVLLIILTVSTSCRTFRQCDSLVINNLFHFSQLMRSDHARVRAVDTL